MIPRIIHQVWIGPKTMPNEWMRSWRDKNPSLQYELWTEQRILEFGLKNKDKYDYYLATGCYCGACDVARVEILERIGGVYLDADLICLEPIENETFMQKDFFAVPVLTGQINNAVIGSVAGHPILQNYIKRITDAKNLEPPFCTIGASMLTRCILEYLKNDNIEILPTYSFYPKNKRRHLAPAEGKAYANHKWGSTVHLYK